MNQSVPERITNHAGTIADLQLFHNRRPMRLNSPNRKVESLSGLAISEPKRDMTKDLSFALGQLNYGGQFLAWSKVAPTSAGAL